jgi:TonB-linked SusC/RagA family outer membrane protein
MRKLFLLLMGQLFLLSGILAQSKSVSGRVTDENGIPLAKVTVSVKGGNTATTTADDGSFRIQVPSGSSILVFSMVDMDTQEVRIGSQTNLSIRLKKEDKTLSEVVVTGYQTLRKREISTPIAKISGRDIENMPVVSLDRAMQGRASGVAIQANNGIPGGAITVRIRGVGSISAGNDPLYIVDGIQINTDIRANNTQNNPLSFLNPNDIESIEILKDAAASAIYGARAANGVVLITTKKGRSGKATITVNSYYGQTSPLKYFNMVSIGEYYNMRKEALDNANAGFGGFPDRKAQILAEMNVANLSLKDDSISMIPVYDWQRAAFGSGNIKNVEMSMSGGNNTTSFYISGSYNVTDAIVHPVNFKRGNMLTSISHKINQKVTVETKISLSTFKQTAPYTTDGSFLGSPAFSGSLIIPSNPIYRPNGWYFGLPGDLNMPLPPGTRQNTITGVLTHNVVATGQLSNDNYARTNQAIGNVSVNYDITKELKWRSTVGLDYRLVQTQNFRDPRLNDGFALKGNMTVLSNWNTNFITSHVLNYIKTFSGIHNFNALVGTEYRKDANEQISANANTFPSHEFRTISAAANPASTGGFWTGSATWSGFSKINYDYDKKYIVAFTMRYDGSSRFGKNFRWGWFPSVAVAWNAKQELFMQNVDAISDLKLRYSFGRTGNDQIGNFSSLGLYGTGRVYNNAATITPSQLGNPNLKWETRQENNVGMDIGFLRNRINVTIDAYRRVNKDLLLDRPLYTSSGFSSITQNVGRVMNKGIEFGADIRVIDGRNFKWRTNFNYTFQENEVLSLYDTLKFLPASPNIRVGASLGSIFTNPYAGVNPATGRPMWYDINNNLVYTTSAADRRLLGNSLPKHFGGWNNTFTYKFLELDVFFNYEYGRVLTDGQVNFAAEIGGRAFSALKEFYDRRWTTPGQITDVPRPINANAETRGSSSFAGDRMFYKADYIRLKQVTLTYNAPPDVTKKMHLNGFRLYVQGLNLLTYDDWPGYDPEFINTATGIVPQSKSMTVGVQVNF